MIAIIVVAVLMTSRRRREAHAEAERRKAADLRQQAYESDVARREREAAAASADAAAKQAEAEAMQAKLEAERLARESASHRADAQQLQTESDERLQKADRVDPDVDVDQDATARERAVYDEDATARERAAYDEDRPPASARRTTNRARRTTNRWPPTSAGLRLRHAATPPSPHSPTARPAAGSDPRLRAAPPTQTAGAARFGVIPDQLRPTRSPSRAVSGR